uniref:Uncharacterized protein n=1 Tax=Arundo donax TaxID=35708 RepID=A0A0A8YWK9_ARUDO
MADEPSDACSCTNEDNARGKRKRRRRASDAYTYANRRDRTGTRKKIMKAYLTSCFATCVGYFIYVFADDEADEDLRVDLLEKAVEWLASVKAMIERELGPNSGISEEILAGLQEIPDSEQDDVPGASEIFSSDDDKFTSLIALPFDMKRKWILMQVGKK